MISIKIKERSSGIICLEIDISKLILFKRILLSRNKIFYSNWKSTSKTSNKLVKRVKLIIITVSKKFLIRFNLGIITNKNNRSLILYHRNCRFSKIKRILITKYWQVKYSKIINFINSCVTNLDKNCIKITTYN